MIPHRFASALCFALLAGALAVGTPPATRAAHAGWEIEQSHYTRRPTGETFSTRTTVMRVSKGRARIADDPLTMLIDYQADRLTLLLPTKQLFWTGTSRDYLRELAQAYPRAHAHPDVNPAPQQDGIEIAVEDTGTTETVGERTAAKYRVDVKGLPHQEIWVAKDLDLRADLDPKLLQEFQARIGAGLRGADGAIQAALNRNPAYLKLYATGFPVRIHSYMGTAIVGRDVVRVTPATVDDAEFAVPKGFRTVPLVELLDAREAPAATKKAK